VKKILIGFIILIMITFLCLTLIKGLPVGNFRIESISDIKSVNDDLTIKAEIAKEKQEENEQQTRVLKGSIESLRTVKAKYEAKMQYLGEEANLESIGLKGYQLDFLFTKVDTYAAKRGIDLQMDLKSTGAPKVYNIEFIAIGSYVGITDFLYDIENDGNLNFRIYDFQIGPSGVSVDPEKPSTGDSTKLQATFTVRDVEIQF